MGFLRHGARAVLLLFAGVATARADVVLDQYSFLTPGNSGIALLSGGSIRRAQTLTVGVSGTLDHILVEFNLGILYWPESEAHEMRILSVENGVPGEVLATSALRTVSFQSSSSADYAFGSFDFSGQGLRFDAGDVLAFEIMGGAIQWYENTNAGGNSFLIDPTYAPGYWHAEPEIDQAFQTFMSPVPIPGAALLLCSGILGFAMCRRLPRWEAVVDESA